jgi:hypothetical protein
MKYFEKPGKSNTNKTIDIVFESCTKKKIKSVVVASSSGATALRLRDTLPNSVQVICVTYSEGVQWKEEVLEFKKNRANLEKKGIMIVKGLHSLSGVERGIQNRYNSPLLPLNLIADTLKLFGQGMKVCVEVAVMAADAGYISPKDDVIVVGGSGEGADTAVVMKPAYASHFFEMKIKEILCKPL